MKKQRLKVKGCFIDSSTTESKYNKLVEQISIQCREHVKANPPKPPCVREDRIEPTQYTFCRHNLNIQYSGNKPIVGPCGICMKKPNAGPKKAPELSPEERLAACIECIARPLPKWFNDGIPNECKREDRFICNYPKRRLGLKPEPVEDENCLPIARCTKTPIPFDETKYVPDYRNKPLTPKFYSRYEQLTNIDLAKAAVHQKEMQRRLDYDPRDRYCIPMYTNQFYGWLRNTETERNQACELTRAIKPVELKILREILQKRLRYTDQDIKYCLCAKELKKKDHWKIV